MAFKEQLAFSAEIQDRIKKEKILAGFDGFIDSLYRPLRKSGDTESGRVYFKTIREFGNYIAGRADKSASIEMDLIQRRMGGNMPNFISAAAALGAECTAIGMLGDGNGGIDAMFSALPGDKYPYAPAGAASVLEFDDGKIFLAQCPEFSGDQWEKITAITGPALLQDIVQNAGLTALLNWSELPFSDRLWRNFYHYCTVNIKPDRAKFMFFDLCDMGRKTGDKIKGVLALIGSFSAFRYTMLSLNYNEAMEAGAALGNGGGNSDMEELAVLLLKRYPLDEVVIHSHTEALNLSKSGCRRSPAPAVKKPKISTGAGDTFNAAYCIAALLDFDARDKLEFAQLCAHFYISSGARPGFAELAEYPVP
jgi:sugar/nucleoside kinase (ribokinase family)